MVGINNALAAYKAAAAGAMPERTPPTSGGGSNGESFAELVKGTVTNAVEANREGERMAMKAIVGEADMRDVVVAVNNAEVALETVVAIRDKVVSAYQEILRMPI